VKLNADIKANTTYWFDVSIRDPQISDATPLSATVALSPTDATDNKKDISVPSLLSWEGRSGYFPIPYRGWGVAGYNGAATSATEAIHESAFVIDTSNLPTKDDAKAPTGYDDPSFKPPPTSDRAYSYIPVVKATKLSDTPVPNQPDPLATPMWE